LKIYFSGYKHSVGSKKFTSIIGVYAYLRKTTSAAPKVKGRKITERLPVGVFVLAFYLFSGLIPTISWLAV